jgi:hypothetical protein
VDKLTLIIILFYLFSPLIKAQNYYETLGKDKLHSFSNAFSNDDTLNNNQPEINWTRAAIVGGGAIALNTFLFVYYQEVYYKNEPSSKLHAESDWYNYALNIDKFGHIHSTISLHRFFRQAAEWCDFSETTSLWIASAFSWSHMLTMEISDGLHKNWGFSWGDFGSNTIGALYPNLQYYVPFMENFNLKVTYFPSPNYDRGWVSQWIEDYEGRKYWITINVHNLLPTPLESYCPDWLQLAIGYGGTQLIVPNPEYPTYTKLPWKYNSVGKQGLGEQEWYIALDYDLLKLFKPEKGTFWYTLLDDLNLVHFPAPTIRISPSSIYYGLYF